MVDILWIQLIGQMRWADNTEADYGWNVNGTSDIISFAIDLDNGYNVYSRKE